MSNRYEGKPASDLEAANFLLPHLKEPCNPGPGQEHLHVGPVYYREAKKLLESFTDESAKMILKSAMAEYVRVFGDPDKDNVKE